MKTEESEYVGYDGTKMFLRAWLPDAEPRALVIGIHGLGSHSGLMSFHGENFAAKGMAFFVPDLRGFGNNPGLKGHVEKFDEYIEDMNSLVAQLKDRMPNKPTYMFGHSLGGLHVIRYAATYPDELDGIIIPCPAVSERLEVSAGLRIMAKLLSKLNIKKTFNNGLNFDLLSRNPEVVRRNREDPLRVDAVTPRFAVEGLAARVEGAKLGPKITLPVLEQQAGDDLILIPEENKAFFDTIASSDKTFKLYPGLYHDPFEEPGGDEFVADMFSWLEEKLPS